jgi:hypothetical protein
MEMLVGRHRGRCNLSGLPPCWEVEAMSAASVGVVGAASLPGGRGHAAKIPCVSALGVEAMPMRSCLAFDGASAAVSSAPCLVGTREAMMASRTGRWSLPLWCSRVAGLQECTRRKPSYRSPPLCEDAKQEWRRPPLPLSS